jgi:hypothetical protein
VTKSPVIKANDGMAGWNVRIKANIFLQPESTFPITIKPSIIEFPESGETTITELYFSMINKSKQDLKPTLISSPKSLVSVILPKTIPANGSADGSIRIKNAGLKKVFEKSVTIELNDNSHTRFTIPVTRGIVEPPKPAAKGQTVH